MNAKRFFKFAFNVLLPLAVAVGLAYYFYDKLSDPRLREHPPTLQWEWLLAGGLVYLVCHTIWSTFWWILLREQNVSVSWLVALRSYYVSQFGKYVPGKIWVIVIRVKMLGRGKISKPTVGVTGTFEGLTSMGAGAFVAAVLLLAFAIKNDNLGWRVYLLIPLALMPLGLRGLNRLVARIYDKRRKPDSPRWPRVGFFTLLGGVLNASVGWLLLGFSFWLILQGLRPEAAPWDWEHVGHLTAINALGYVIGFLALFMPAGAGVREAIIQYMLTYELIRAGFPAEGEGFAAVAAIVMRLVWTTAELGTATILYFAVQPPEELLREEGGEFRHTVVE